MQSDWLLIFIKSLHSKRSKYEEIQFIKLYYPATVTGIMGEL